MSFSHNEVMALATKAARGAQAGPAQAQLFGRMIVCHLGAGRSVQSLIDVLDTAPGGAITAGPLLCRTIVQNAESSARVSASFDLPQDIAQSYLDTLATPRLCTFVSSHTDHGAYEIPPLAPAPLPERLELPTPLLTRLNQLAKLTYVPNSDASRSGAGAGLNDND